MNVSRIGILVMIVLWSTLSTLQMRRYYRDRAIAGGKKLSPAVQNCTGETWCMFIQTRFYGRHSEHHRSQTLNWFEDVTLESVHRALQIRKHHDCIDVKVYYLLRNTDAYAGYDFPKVWKEKSKDLIKTATFNQSSLREMSLFKRKVLEDNNCSITSSIRIDGDDMFDNFFSDLLRGYLKFMKKKAAKEEDRRVEKLNAGLNLSLNQSELGAKVAFDDVLVQGSRATRNVFWSDSGCQYHYTGHPYVMSQGLSITAPASGYLRAGWLEQFNNYPHDKLERDLKRKVEFLKEKRKKRKRQKMKELEALTGRALPASSVTLTGQEWIPNVVRFVPLGKRATVYVLTSLSSHWNLKRGKKCTFLLDKNILSPGVFKILSNARSLNVTEKDQLENSFFKQFNKQKYRMLKKQQN